ncbi:MAG TPA: ATP-dependent zinc metalloprotease FtsH [Phycisphaerae bacterium]|nr:ATP-dependent zinc metalloprotease FtsH [Phycisphaerae bacterium]
MPDSQQNPSGGKQAPENGSSNSPRGSKPGRDNNNMQFSRSMMTWLFFLGLIVVGLLVLHPPGGSPQRVDYSDYQRQLEQTNVNKVTFNPSGDINFTTIKPLPGDPANTSTDLVTSQPPNALTGDGWALLTQEMEKYGVHSWSYNDNDESYFWNILFQVAIWVGVILVIYFLMFRQIKSAGGGIGMLGSFGRSRHRLLSKEHTNITFNDVAGIDEAKEELSEIVEFLKNPRKFQRLGGRIPRGVLLIGAPGVGKTLLAKAIAGEADVPFFSISGSDFVEMFVGVGASRVRDLFKTAKESSPCIVFLDEIDAVGRRRGNGFSSGGHDEREQTLNAILVEMDGFDTNDQVIVVAATNRSDILDPALTRPGRFDRQVTVPLPDIKGRYEILKVHARKVKLAPDVDMLRLARQTPMFSGADLAAIINESALIATMLNREAIEMSDLEEARDKIRFGKARRSRAVDEEEKLLTAWHEAGHAVVQFFSPSADPIHKVTIIPRGPYGGATFSLPEKDRLTYSRKYLLAELRTLFGGRVAEELYLGEISSGASMDIKQASVIAREMVCNYGMSEALGPIRFGHEENAPWFEGQREYSEKTAELIDSEVHRLISTAYTEARNILIEKKQELATLKDALLKYETLDIEDVKRIMSGQALTKPTVGDILAAEQRRTPEIRPGPQPHTEGPTISPFPQPG